MDPSIKECHPDCPDDSVDVDDEPCRACLLREIEYRGSVVDAQLETIRGLDALAERMAEALTEDAGVERPSCGSDYDCYDECMGGWRADIKRTREDAIKAARVFYDGKGPQGGAVE